ncbi:FAD binding domain-containing protein [Rhodopseudomonas sp. HC1]|uniref:FAD binding domain-containing protein n=1 Tax=Rhodopseudomonas infernalis TaxID=2897386 RepID=UPI001EE7E237|nr:FAD binding domain-containing protein [Rhodopseudomonas infernalis]MCG6204239.1 FAD binding domain-containing protein [Rhodopseudomonas infernalis]
MRLAPFQLHRPNELQAALALREKFGDDSAYYAGGTELLLALKARVLRYDHLIDLKRIAGFDRLALDGNEVVIGPLVTHLRLATDPLIRDRLPAYAKLADNVGNIRVRASGTLAGNLCFSEPHADPPALLCLLGATLMLHGPDGERSVPMAEFILGPFTTARADDEILTAIRIPLPAADERICYRSFGHLEYPAVGVAASYRAQAKGRYRVWIGCIGDNPIQAEAVEAALDGVPPGALSDVLPQAADAMAADLPATDDIYGSADYKRHLAAVFIKRAVLESAGVEAGR